MKQVGENIIAAPGKYIISGAFKGLKMPAGPQYEERAINIENLQRVGDYVYVDKLLPVKIGTHAEMKTELVKKLYSNDDQIAIMLNGNQEDMDFMQDWRSFISKLLHKIEEIM